MADEKSNVRHYDTIVIGAGMSGLACASRLLEHASYKNGKRLLVLEARNRVGGRIESVHLNGNRLDTGANWIHGIGTEDRPNPLVQILPHKKFKELSRSVSFRPPPSTDSTRPVIAESHAEHDWVKVDASKALPNSAPKEDLVIPSQIADHLFSALWQMIGALHETAVEKVPDRAFETTMLREIAQSEVFKCAFADIPEEYFPTLCALPQFIENMEAGPLNSSSAEHPADEAGMGLLEFALDDFDGDQVFLQDGYTNLIEEVGKHVISEGHVKLGVEVRSIHWDAGPISISTSDGIHTAARVICTIPLGVLQEHIRSQGKYGTAAPLFQPELPSEKMEAITSLGFGTLDKIFMVYSKAWWTEEPYVSILKKGLIDRPMSEECLWTETYKSTSAEPDSFFGFTDELAGVVINTDNSATPGPRALSVINLHTLTGFPVLSSFVSCANAVHVEGLSNHAAGMIIHRALTKWLGREPPLPDAVHVTRWAQDAYSCGSYSHMITNLSKTSHRTAFQTPLVNKQGSELRFAGEHTSLNHFATVHGALLSGWREADAIIEADVRGTFNRAGPEDTLFSRLSRQFT